MGWPKGMPRKGHVNKDGTTHARKGAKVVPQVRVGRKVSIVQVDASALDNDGNDETWFKPGWKALLVHKNGPWTTLCPRCGFPEAEGGYCPACGWMEPIGVGKW